MSEELKEELLQVIEGAANYMSGMAFDPSLGQEQKEALNEKSEELRSIVEKYLD